MGDRYDDLINSVVLDETRSASSNPAQSVSIEPAGSSSAPRDRYDDLIDSVMPQAAPTYAPGIDTSRNFETITGAMTRGAALGSFDDEILGGEYAVQQAIADLFGMDTGKGRSMAENYAIKSQAVDAQNKAFQKENPGTAIMAGIGGGMLPAIFTGGGSLLGGETLNATGVIGRPIANLFGAGIKSTPGALRLAEMGVTGGAVSGFGEGRSFSERAQNSAISALFGGMLAPVFGKGLEYGFKGIGNLTAPLRSRISLGSSAPMAAEAGGIPVKVSEGYTPGELMLAKELKNVPEEKVAAALNEITDAVDTGTPLFLPEAINDRGVNTNAKFIANYKPSISEADGFISARHAPDAVASRADSALGRISQEKSAFEGANKITGAADEILTGVKDWRQKRADPLYKEAYALEPVIVDPKLDDLIAKDKHLAAAISDVRKTYGNADKPENSTSLLVQARKYLWNAAEKLDDERQGAKASDLKDTYYRLNDILHENPKLKEADALFSSDSETVTALNETFLKSLSQMSGDRVKNAGKVFDLSPERITELRDTFFKAGKGAEWNAGIRSHLQQIYEGAKDGQNYASKIVDSPALRSKLKAALGEGLSPGDNFETVAKALSYESRFGKGKNVYQSTSTTEPLRGEKEAFQAATSIFENVKRGNYMAALGKLLSSDLDAETAKEMARIYFDPKTGKTSLEKVIPLLKAYAASDRLAEIIAKNTEKATRPVAGRIATKTTGSDKRASNPPISATSRSGVSSASVSPKAKPNRTAAEALEAIRAKLNGEVSTRKSSSAISRTMTPKKTASAIKETFSKKDIAMTADLPPPQVIAAVERQIDSDPFDAAVYEMESSRNPNAKNPKSSASGGFQLISSTAKKLGVKDVFDLSQNYEGFKALKDENAARFGNDPRALYSAHFLGATLLAKVQRGEELTDKEQGHVDELLNVALPRFMKIYKKTSSKTVEA